MSLPIRSAVLMAAMVVIQMSSPGTAWSATEADTAAVARDVAKEERNRRIVVDFYNGVFNRHDVAGSAAALVDSYIQHNPGVPDGKAPFVKHFTEFFKNNPNARSRIVRSAADGDLVYLHVHSTNGESDRGRAIVDIFRVENGKVVEHWDVIQRVPDQAANGNTMF